MRGSCCISLCRPLSQTKRTPSIVTDVSATLVDKTHLRTPSGAASNTLSCSSALSALCRGRMIHRLDSTAYGRTCSATAPISAIPGKKTSKSPR